MYIHEEIQKAVLPLLKKYDLELIDLIGELNKAAWELSVLSKHGIDKLIVDLEVHNVELTGSPASSNSDLIVGVGYVRTQLKAQGQNGNWDYSPYMQGMYNGMEFALATLDGRDAEYKSAPDKWLCDIPYDESELNDGLDNEIGDKHE